jgi:hypothetical protein|tara:strand:- start:1299 stop:1748 length:450 start_codon:yes stop_codon:yes gene_type:complete
MSKGGSRRMPQMPDGGMRFPPVQDGGFLPRPSPPFMRPPRQQTPSLPFGRDMARFRYAPEMRAEEQSLFPNQSGIASLMGQAYGRSMSRPNYQPMRQPPMRRPMPPRPKGGGMRPLPMPPTQRFRPTPFRPQLTTRPMMQPKTTPFQIQ